MTEAPSFVPRSWLEHPEDFAMEPDPAWRVACSLDEAVQAARAIRQYHLAIEVSRLLRRNRNSVADLAAVLH